MKIQVKIKSEISDEKSTKKEPASARQEERHVEHRPDRHKPAPSLRPPAPREAKLRKRSSEKVREERSDVKWRQRSTRHRGMRKRYNSRESSEEDQRFQSKRVGTWPRRLRTTTRGRGRRRHSRSRSRGRDRGHKRERGRERERERERERDHRPQHKSPPPAKEPSVDNEVSTSLLELYEEMVSKTIESKGRQLSKADSQKLQTLRAQCGVTEDQHNAVLRRLGFQT